MLLSSKVAGQVEHFLLNGGFKHGS
jgi:hypothetical protein